jgi:hypothetical protein
VIGNDRQVFSAGAGSERQCVARGAAVANHRLADLLAGPHVPNRQVQLQVLRIDDCQLVRPCERELLEAALRLGQLQNLLAGGKRPDADLAVARKEVGQVTPVWTDHRLAAAQLWLGNLFADRLAGAQVDHCIFGFASAAPPDQAKAAGTRRKDNLVEIIEPDAELAGLERRRGRRRIECERPDRLASGWNVLCHFGSRRLQGRRFRRPRPRHRRIRLDNGCDGGGRG